MFCAHHGGVQSVRFWLIPTYKRPRRPHPFEAAQSFGQYGLGQAAPLVLRRRAHRLVIGAAGHVVVPDGAKRSDLAGRGDGHQVQITAIKWHPLDVMIPLPPFIAFVWLFQ